MSTAQPPVFVDDTGRRRILTRRAVRIVLIGFTAYLGLLALGLARDPRVGPLQLPTFGLPGLALMTPPAPSVLGEQAAQGAAGSTVPEPLASHSSGPPTPGTSTAPTRKATPSTSPSSTSTTAPPTSTTSSTTISSSTTSSTTTTSRPGQGQGRGPVSGSGYGAASAKGPDGSGAPGQERKSTTVTTAG